MLSRREERLTLRNDLLDRRIQECKDEISQLYAKAFGSANVNGLTPEWFAIKEALIALERVRNQYERERLANSILLKSIRNGKATLS